MITLDCIDVEDCGEGKCELSLLKIDKRVVSF